MQKYLVCERVCCEDGDWSVTETVLTTRIVFNCSNARNGERQMGQLFNWKLV